MTNDPNWTKTKVYYLVIGHACDEESAWLYLDFEEEKTNDFLEKKFIEFVLEELGYDPDSNKEVYIDFIFRSSGIFLDFEFNFTQIKFFHFF